MVDKYSKEVTTWYLRLRWSGDGVKVNKKNIILFQKTLSFIEQPLVYFVVLLLYRHFALKTSV
jgi:hypothetical protein